MSTISSLLLEIAQALQLSEQERIGMGGQYPSLKIASKEEFFSLVLAIGRANGKGAQAEEIVEDMEQWIGIVQHKLKFIKEEEKPSVLCLTQVDPFLVETSPYMSGIIQIAGGRIYPAPPARDGEFLNPDILLLLSDQMERLFGELGALLSSEAWKNSNAVKNNAVFLLNGQDHFRDFGLGLAEDIESLAEILYPKQLTFGGNGERWIQFET